ncbi:PepSY domain-containing protein [Psychrobacter sp. AH5]|uniref:PepSY domain-containing protein n=1 Tax=Psychrobacter sp. AH5 TaxID=2937433 RepID=UPI00334113F6
MFDAIKENKQKLPLVALSACLALSTITISTAANADVTEEIRAAQATKVSLKQAINIAKKQAKGTLMSVELDEDSDTKNNVAYEMKFSDGATEYEVKVDAITGQVVKVEKERLDKEDINEYNNQNRAKISAMAVIGAIEKQAKAQVLEIEFDNDGDYADHPSYYEVDMLRDNQIIELKIDASTGREFSRRVKS